MTLDEYSTVCEEFLDGGFYPDLVLRKLWDYVRCITAAELRAVLEHLLLSTTRSPSAAQIRAACGPAIHRALEDSRRRELKSAGFQCRLCGGSGWVTAYRVGQPLYEFAFVCSCPAADARGITGSRGAQSWRDASADESLVPRTMDDAGAVGWREATEDWQDAMKTLVKRTDMGARR